MRNYLNRIRCLMMRILKRRVTYQGVRDSPWQCDPLSHPVLRSMSSDQLADLPFDPHRFC